MKRIINFILLFIIFAPSVIFGQMYEQGNIIGDVFAGGPNVSSVLVKASVKSIPGIFNLKNSSSVPFGGKFEYLLSNRIGIGLNVNYASSSISASYLDTSYSKETYSAKFIYSRVRIFPTVNIHMGSNEKLDPYFSFGLGYNRSRLRTETNAPRIPFVNFTLPFPLAYRLELGLRYFIITNFGFNIQLGFGGGPLFAGGLSFKY